MNFPILNVRDLTKSYATGAGRLTVLHNVSFTLQQGATCSILGPSGSGKTTLLGLAAGLDLPTSGSVLLNGIALAEITEDERARVRNAHVGFVFQNFQLIPTLTALENVTVPMELRGDRGARVLALDLLKRVGLGERSTHYPAQLSGGEQQRVALARAFINRPKVLFADEPTGNLDAETSQAVIEIMLELNRTAGTALVLVTHDPDVARLTERTIRLAQRRDDRMRMIAKALMARSTTNFAFIPRMAWRDSRSSRWRLLLFSISISLGVAALIAIGLFRASLAQAIDDQARSLLGADLVVESSRPFTAEQEQMLRSLGETQAREVRFRTMALFPKSGGTRLVHVRALGGSFPFYGKMETAPPAAAHTFRDGGEAVPEESLLFQFRAKPGDPIKIGEATFTIAGALTKMPGEASPAASFAPRVYIPLQNLAPPTCSSQAASPAT